MYDITSPYWNLTVILSTWPDVGDFKRRMNMRYMRVHMFSTHPTYGSKVDDAISRMIDCFDEAIDPDNNIETLIIVDMYCEKLGSAALAMLRAHPDVDFRFMGTVDLNLKPDFDDNELRSTEYVKDWVKKCVDAADERFAEFYEFDKISSPVKYDYDCDPSRYEDLDFGSVREIYHPAVDSETNQSGINGNM